MFLKHKDVCFLKHIQSNRFCHFWFTDVFLVIAVPPLETLLTQFRKLQPSPLEVGDHLIIGMDVFFHKKEVREHSYFREYTFFGQNLSMMAIFFRENSEKRTSDRLFWPIILCSVERFDVFLHSI